MTRARSLVLAALALGALVSNAAAQSGSIKAAWQVVAVTAADGKVDTAPQPGLYVFTDKHYSIRRVNAVRPAATGVGSADKDRLAAYDACQTGKTTVKLQRVE